MSRFVDRVVLHVGAGNGGHGCASIHREKFKPLGGPDGGNGGHGGSVILEVDTGIQTLLDFHYHPHIKAPKGKPGMGSHREGARGEDLVLQVPEGTVVLDEDGRVLADLTGAGSRIVAARGGRGGLGNAALASRARKAPGFALFGEEGEQRELTVELKSVADIGLVGFPSAGKSSLVSVLSAAKPKIAEYPFTTLAPNLGVVSAGEMTFTVADVPGLMPGAADGRGLGLDFLRHVERCAVLAHVVDCATLEPGRDPVSDVDAIEDELASYRPALAGDSALKSLADRPRVVVLNKADVPDGAELAEFVADEFAERGWPVFTVSAVSHDGLRELSFALAGMVRDYRAENPPAERSRPVIRPLARGDAGFTVECDRTGVSDFIVRGRSAERWVSQTPFDNDEAVGFLADKLARMGVEDELQRLGAQPGDAVTIGAVTFEWEPIGPAGLDAPERGADAPAEQSDRVSARDRKHAHRVRRGLVDGESPDDPEPETDDPDGGNAPPADRGTQRW